MSEVPVEDAPSVRKQLEEPSLYASRVRVYPKRIRGTFRRLKWTGLIVLLGIYYLAPWLRWDRGRGAPDQAFLIDMPHRRAYFLWIEIWPQEVYYLAGLLILGALGLFLATSLFGRVWCGFSCPQTVWTDLFIWVERQIEGDRAQRIRLDKSPLSTGKVAKKVAKHGTWLVISVLTGGAWIVYFKDAPTLVAEIVAFEVAYQTVLFIGLFTATTYLLAGIAREQVCTYMCPWPRFQAAMFDEDSLIVTYERWRGEPRAPHKKGTTWDDRGDCVDCNQCVAVCPTGIDIRDGNQLECIGCALCVDACNDIMARVGRPPNLITYDTTARQQARAEGRPPRYRLLRLRTMLYMALLVLVGSIMVIGLATRTSLDVNVLHDRNPLFVKLSDGAIRNGFTVKILNKRRAVRDFTLRTDGLPEAEIFSVGREGRGAALHLTAEADTVTTYRVFVAVPPEALSADGVRDFVFELDEIGGSRETARYDASLRGPER